MILAKILPCGSRTLNQFPDQSPPPVEPTGELRASVNTSQDPCKFPCVLRILHLYSGPELDGDHCVNFSAHCKRRGFDYSWLVVVDGIDRCGGCKTSGKLWKQVQNGRSLSLRPSSRANCSTDWKRRSLPGNVCSAQTPSRSKAYVKS